MKVTIATISFNQVRFLEKAITSVLEQDYKDIEYIIVDPGSTDGSREIIDRFREQIQGIIFEPDDGPADGLNKAFRMASGEIFGYIPSDDYLYPHCISKIVEAFSREPNLDVVSGHGDVVDENGRFRRRVYSDEVSLQRIAYDTCTVVGQVAYFKADTFRKVGGYNVTNRIAWDGELWVDMAKAGSTFGVINDVLGAFRVYPGTITSELQHGHPMKSYRDAMFERIMGRRWNKRDGIIRQGYRVMRYIREPRSLYQRLAHGPVVQNVS